MNVENLTLDVQQQIEIAAPQQDVFAGMLSQLGEGNTTPDEQPLAMQLERWPGGRWYRDLGDDTGHLWGFVQVIKPPALLEIAGPMFMSYPAAGHLALRLTEADGVTKLSLRHRVLGLIEEGHREGVVPGWEHFLQEVKSKCE